LQHIPSGVGISDRNADKQKATVRNSQFAILQLLSLNASIQETNKALYDNLKQVKSDIIITYQNEDKKHTANTVIEACSKSDNHKLVNESNKNERMIKFDPTSAIQSQLYHVDTNPKQLKSSLPIKKWSNSKNDTNNIFQKKRLFSPFPPA
jgi:hypothetical protein